MAIPGVLFALMLPTITFTSGARPTSENGLGWRQSDPRALQGSTQPIRNQLIVAWGSNSVGQLDAPELPGDINSTAAGSYSSAAITKDNVLYVWGDSSLAINGWTNVSSVALGDGVALCLFVNGTIAEWGSRTLGQTQIPAGATVTAVAAGGDQSMALLSDGAVRAWGTWKQGYVSSAPFIGVDVPPGLINVTAIAAGDYHALYLLGNGTVVAHSASPTGGADGYRFDNNNSSNDWSPIVAVPTGARANVIAIAAGAYHSLALRDDGTVVAWGWNNQNPWLSPDLRVGYVTAVSGGWSYFMVLRLDGTIVKFGTNGRAHHAEELSIVPAFANSGVRQIAAGWDHALALVDLPGCGSVPDGYIFYQRRDSADADLPASDHMMPAGANGVDADAMAAAKAAALTCDQTSGCVGFTVKNVTNGTQTSLRSNVTDPMIVSNKADFSSVCHGLYVKDAPTPYPSPPPSPPPSIQPPPPPSPPFQPPPSPLPSPVPSLPPPSSPPANGSLDLSPSGPKSGTMPVGAIAGICVGVLALVLVAVGIWVAVRKRDRRPGGSNIGMSMMPTDPSEGNPHCLVQPIDPSGTQSGKLLCEPAANTSTAPNSGPHLASHHDTGTGMASSTTDDITTYQVTLLRRMTIPWNSIKIGRELGRGGFGLVVKGEWMGTPVAVKMINLKKVIASTLSPDQPMETRATDEVQREALAMGELRREALAMCELRHLHMAQVFGLVDDGVHTALVMRYYRRGTVAAAISDHHMETGIWFTGLELAGRLKMAKEVASGMSYLHDGNMLHGDLKTSNLLIDDNGCVVIADFGLSGMAGQAVAGGALTISIRPPEVLNDPRAPRTAAGDVYAFGVVVWEIVCGQVAYAGMSPPLIHRVVTTGKRPTIPEWVPPDVAALIADCWTQEAAARPTFAEVLGSLKDVVLAHGSATGPAGRAATGHGATTTTLPSTWSSTRAS